MMPMLVTILLTLITAQDVSARQGGTVTGVLRDDRGLPAPGVRVAAVVRTTAQAKTSDAAMAAITQTDEEGRFKLENVPPGRYVIAAGRLDLQTYFPGTQFISEARIIAVEVGATASEINFVLKSTSAGRTPKSSDDVVRMGTASIPISIRMADGGLLPPATVVLASRSIELRFAIAQTRTL
jgi:5-hydroxyisourate hydrolase-like protein (transthyretin family)